VRRLRLAGSGSVEAMSLDIEAPLHDLCAVRIALVPVGGTDGPTFRRLSALLHPLTTLDVSLLSNGERRGAFKLHFVEAGGGISDWDELYPHRRVRAVIGLCHFPSSVELGASYGAFVQRGASLSSTALIMRCFVFESPENGVIADLPSADNSRLDLIAPAVADMRMHVKELLHELGAELLRDIRAEAETPPNLSANLTTPSDSGSTAAGTTSTFARLLSSATGRVTGRHQKRKADLKLLCGSTADARIGYEKAIESISRSGADAVWHAAALEGAAAAQLAQLAQALRESSAAGGAAGGDLAAYGEAYDEALGLAKKRLEEACKLCAERGGRAVEVAVEIGFRLARLIGEIAERERGRLAVTDDIIAGGGPDAFGPPPPPSPWRHRRIEAQSVLQRRAYEQATGTETPLGLQLQLRVCLGSAALSSELGQHRKAAFYLLEAARRYRNTYQWRAAHEVLLVAAPQLQLAPLQFLQLHAPWRPPLPLEPRPSLAAAVGATFGSVVLRMVDVNSQGWSYLRQVVLAMLLEATVALDDAPLYASYALFTLRLIEGSLPHDQQKRLVGLLTQAAPQIAPCMPAPAIGLPWLLRIKPLKLSNERLPHKRVVAQKRSRPDFEFLTDPFSRARKAKAAALAALRVLWIRGETISALVTVSNRLCVPLYIDHVALHGTLVRATPDSATAASPTRDVAAPTKPNAGTADGLQANPRFVAFGQSVLLPEHCPGMEVELTGLVDGGAAGDEWRLLLHGLEVRAFGFECIHPVDSNGFPALLPASAYSPIGGNQAGRSGELMTGTSFDRRWQPPPPMDILLAPPLPLLSADPASLMVEALGELHVGQRVTIALRLTNVSSLHVRALRASLRPSGALPLTLAKGFKWYHHTPLSLFDESESDGAISCHRFELGVDAISAQLPLPPSQQLAIPIKLLVGTPADCACEVHIDYDGGPPTGAVSHPGSSLEEEAVWTRKLTLPLTLNLGRGLVLSPEVIVQSDPYRLYMEASRPLTYRASSAAAETSPWASVFSWASGTAQGSASVATPPPGCLLILSVSNEHASATFELECFLGAHLTSHVSVGDVDLASSRSAAAAVAAASSTSTSGAAGGGARTWLLAPGALHRIVLPICCLERTEHPLPSSAQMLEQFFKPPDEGDRSNRPAVALAEAERLRAAHQIKAMLLEGIQLRWRRQGERLISGVLPLTPIVLTNAQVDTLCRPAVSLCAQLCANGARPWVAPGPSARPLRKLLIRITAAADEAATSQLVVRVRGGRRGSERRTDGSATTAGSSMDALSDSRAEQGGSLSSLRVPDVGRNGVQFHEPVHPARQTSAQSTNGHVAVASNADDLAPRRESPDPIAALFSRRDGGLSGRASSVEELDDDWHASSVRLDEPGADLTGTAAAALPNGAAHSSTAPLISSLSAALDSNPWVGFPESMLPDSSSQFHSSSGALSQFHSSGTDTQLSLDLPRGSSRGSDSRQSDLSGLAQRISLGDGPAACGRRQGTSFSLDEGGEPPREPSSIPLEVHAPPKSSREGPSVQLPAVHEVPSVSSIAGAVPLTASPLTRRHFSDTPRALAISPRRLESPCVNLRWEVAKPVRSPQRTPLIGSSMASAAVGAGRAAGSCLAVDFNDVGEAQEEDDPDDAYTDDEDASGRAGGGGGGVTDAWSSGEVHDGTVMWHGAVEALLPRLTNGQTFEHIVGVSFTEAGDYRLAIQVLKLQTGRQGVPPVIAETGIYHLEA
jgi:hypothetical protein